MHDRSGASLEPTYPHVPFRPRSIRCACGASAASRKVCRRGLSEGGASEAEERYLRHRHHFLAERWRSMPPADARVHHATPRRSESGTGTPGKLGVLRGIGSYHGGATGTSREPKSFTGPRAARLPDDRQEGARFLLR
jgi:hypothetical protein